jgi:hypothetical protein
MSEILHAAIQYALRGWPVVPLHGVDSTGRCDCGAMDRETEIPGWKKHNPGKEPYEPTGHRAASTDLNQIQIWWTKYPNANVAIQTGWKSGVTVLDVDAAHEGDPEFDGFRSLDAMERKHGPLPMTLMAKSGQGRHYYFRYPQGLDLRGRRGMRPSVDVRSADNLIVAPPSRHTTGEQYTWLTSFEDTPIAVLPPWLLKMIQTKNPVQKRSVARPMKSIVSGGPKRWFPF